MKIEYDKETDTLTITLREAPVKESDEVRPGVIVDFGFDDGVVGFEILDASRVVERTREMQFAVAGLTCAPAVASVEEMLTLHRQQAAARTPQEQTALTRQIAATDTPIDRLLCDLYGLTEDEINIVESATT
jgi:uncharacterized protein YuzE